MVVVLLVVCAAQIYFMKKQHPARRDLVFRVLCCLLKISSPVSLIISIQHKTSISKLEIPPFTIKTIIDAGSRSAGLKTNKLQSPCHNGCGRDGRHIRGINGIF